MSEFESQNAELFGMIERGQRLPRKPVHFIPEAEYERYKAMDAQYTPVKEDPMTDRQKRLIRAAKSIAWTIPAVTFFVGTSEGLMNLYFAGVLAVPFLFLAVGCWLSK